MGKTVELDEEEVRRLARLVPLESLRAEAAGDPLRAYALLLGVAGLLPDGAAARRDAPDRSAARRASVALAASRIACSASGPSTSRPPVKQM
jgi:hypothetical protein